MLKRGRGIVNIGFTALGSGQGRENEGKRESRSREEMGSDFGIDAPHNDLYVVNIKESRRL